MDYILKKNLNFLNSNSYRLKEITETNGLLLFKFEEYVNYFDRKIRHYSETTLNYLGYSYTNKMPKLIFYNCFYESKLELSILSDSKLFNELKAKYESRSKTGTKES